MASLGDRAARAPEYINHHEAPHYNAPEAPQVIESKAFYGANYWDPGRQGLASYPTTTTLHEAEPKGSRRIAGLPTWAFWLLLAIISLVVVGGAVGGAIAGIAGVKSRNMSTSQPSVSNSTLIAPGPPEPSHPTTSAGKISSAAVSSTTGSPTSSTPVTHSSSSSAPPAQLTGDSGQTLYTQPTTDCPNSDGDLYTPNGAGGGRGTYTFKKHCGSSPVATGVNDITEVFVESFNLCIDMCSSWNYYNDAKDSPRCAAVVFLPTGLPPGNCWIKNGSGLDAGLAPYSTQDTAALVQT